MKFDVIILFTCNLVLILTLLVLLALTAIPFSESGYSSFYKEL